MDTKIKFNHPVIKCGIWEDDFPDNIKKDLKALLLKEI